MARNSRKQREQARDYTRQAELTAVEKALDAVGAPKYAAGVQVEAGEVGLLSLSDRIYALVARHRAGTDKAAQVLVQLEKDWQRKEEEWRTNTANHYAELEEEAAMLNSEAGRLHDRLTSTEEALRTALEHAAARGKTIRELERVIAGKLYKAKGYTLTTAPLMEYEANPLVQMLAAVTGEGAVGVARVAEPSPDTHGELLYDPSTPLPTERPVTVETPHNDTAGIEITTQQDVAEGTRKYLLTDGTVLTEVMDWRKLVEVEPAPGVEVAEGNWVASGTWQAPLSLLDHEQELGDDGEPVTDPGRAADAAELHITALKDEEYR